MEKKLITIVHHNLSYKSGEGKVVFTAIDVIKDHKIDFTIATFSKPENEYGLPIKYFLPFHFSKFDRYQRIFVYFVASKIYSRIYLNLAGSPIPLSKKGIHIIYTGSSPFSVTKYSRSLFWKVYRMPYKLFLGLMKDEYKRAKIIANSYYSAKVLADQYGIQPKVIYPPVEYEKFNKAFHENNDGYILTIARIERGKFLERVIEVSSKTKLPAVIVGYLNDKKYLIELEKIAKQKNAKILILTNKTEDELIEIMSKACCYFHPTEGEHFGIPVVEAMSAGLVPIVPRESGASELVPEFSYTTIDEASQKILEIKNIPLSKRKELSEKSKFFSTERFKRELWEYISNFLN
ncbi:glycosyltransferase family 4 protein [Acidianus manzaensis]|uniref:Glycosyl transferase family 1 domain-containing protein n=1 Tax=Acidianus manzaensis TaxID=282676 RepID=A0A1W6JXB1_9CREN|nr:glycosyltransferase family 4 protein [Acidianus manzaensis]ARM74916.1 hypothetical protein B6F84_01995 [Acidianus manzaensis]